MIILSVEAHTKQILIFTLMPRNIKGQTFSNRIYYSNMLCTNAASEKNVRKKLIKQVIKNIFPRNTSSLHYISTPCLYDLSLVKHLKCNELIVFNIKQNTFIF